VTATPHGLLDTAKTLREGIVAQGLEIPIVTVDKTFRQPGTSVLGQGGQEKMEEIQFEVTAELPVRKAFFEVLEKSGPEIIQDAGTLLSGTGLKGQGKNIGVQSRGVRTQTC
jgi:hypothetical protein